MNNIYMGNGSSKKRLSNIPNEEKPYVFLNNQIKLCRVLEVKDDGILHIAFSFKKAILRWLFKLDNFHNITIIDEIEGSNMISMVCQLEKILKNNKYLVYIKFGKFDNNYLHGTMYLNKKDLKKNKSIDEYIFHMDEAYQRKLDISSKYNETFNTSSFKSLNFRPSLESISENQEPPLKMSISKKENNIQTKLYSELQERLDNPSDISTHL